jgi:hypothetical protein
MRGFLAAVCTKELKGHVRTVDNLFTRFDKIRLPLKSGHILDMWKGVSEYVVEDITPTDRLLITLPTLDNDRRFAAFPNETPIRATMSSARVESLLDSCTKLSHSAALFGRSPCGLIRVDKIVGKVTPCPQC